jgi:hypothetical protein
MPAFTLRPASTTMPVVGLIAHRPQVPALCAKLTGRAKLMLVTGDDWLAAFSFQTEVQLPWLQDQPTYLYALAPGLLCQSGYEPDLPAPVLPALIQKFAHQGTFAITQGPKIWDFSAATPIEDCNLRAPA